MNFFHTDQQVKILLFSYLFQVNDWFNSPQTASSEQNGVHEEEAYLSRCLSYKNKIQGFLYERTDLCAKVE